MTAPRVRGVSAVTTVHVALADAEPMESGYRNWSFLPRLLEIRFTDGEFVSATVTGPRVKRDGTPYQRTEDSRAFWSAEDGDKKTPDWVVRLVWTYAPGSIGRPS